MRTGPVSRSYISIMGTRRLLVRWLPVVLLGVGLAHATVGGRIVWKSDLAAARKIAEAGEKPLMICFYGEL